MKYDKTDPKSIEEFGQKLVKGTLRTVVGEESVPETELEKPVSGHTRGSLGTMVERYYYGITPEADGSPDFKEAGVELKTTPLKKNKDGSYVAKERLVLGMIDYLSETEREFETSSYFKKNEKLMLMSYLHETDKKIGDVPFILAKLFEFKDLPQEDRRIIMEDWNKINTKICDQKAHELSEGDTLYLAACTKSATSKNRRPQISGPDAKPRAFSYKPSYMTRLQMRELGTSDDIERLLKVSDIEEGKTFEEQVLERFQPFIGKSVTEICSNLDIELNPSKKDKFATLARAMMGVKRSKVEEFEAAGIKMKTIQLKANGAPKEAMSFPTFKYKKVINEIWDGDEEEGEVRAEFQKQLEARFLFVVYRCDDVCKKDEERILEKVFFWTMPPEDLVEAQRIWEETVRRINEGQANELPKSSESPIAHVRPHAANAEDTYETPQGEQVTKKCFWLNISYLKKVIEREYSDEGMTNIEEEYIESPYVESLVSLPLYDSIGCGEATYADPVASEQIDVPATLVHPGAKYFVLRTSGDSMNKLGIEDGDLILCQKNYQAPSGSTAVVLIGDDATLKEIKYEKDGLLLIPHSTNPKYKERKLVEGDEFKILGTFIQKLDE